MCVTVQSDACAHGAAAAISASDGNPSAKSSQRPRPSATDDATDAAGAADASATTVVSSCRFVQASDRHATHATRPTSDGVYTTAFKHELATLDSKHRFDSNRPMIALLIRGSDAETVAAAVTAFAVEEGFIAVDFAEVASDPMGLVAALNGMHAIVSGTGSTVSVNGLAGLDLAEAEEWAAMLSSVLAAQVLAIEVFEEESGASLRLHDYRGGEAGRVVDVTLDASGTTRAPALAPYAASDEARAAFMNGIAAPDVGTLLEMVLQCLGAEEPSPDHTRLLPFRDPLDDADDADEDVPRLVVDALEGAVLSGSVGGIVESDHGAMAVAVQLGGESAPLRGITLEITGDALSLVRLERAIVHARSAATQPRTPRDHVLATSEDGKRVVLDLPDAHFEPRLSPGMLALDPNDLFGSMQRAMSLGDDDLANTLSLTLVGSGLRAGTSTLTVRAIAARGDVAAGQTELSVAVQGAGKDRK